MDYKNQVRVLVSLAILLFAAPSGAFAISRYTLQEEHGKGLKSVSFVIRQGFWKKKGKEWSKATYEEREAYLFQYYDELKSQEVAERQRERDKYNKEQDRYIKKRDEESARSNKIREKEQKQRQEERDKLQEQREFDQMTREQDRTLQNLRTKQQKH